MKAATPLGMLPISPAVMNSGDARSGEGGVVPGTPSKSEVPDDDAIGRPTFLPAPGFAFARGRKYQPVAKMGPIAISRAYTLAGTALCAAALLAATIDQSCRPRLGEIREGCGFLASPPGDPANGLDVWTAHMLVLLDAGNWPTNTIVFLAGGRACDTDGATFGSMPR